VKKLHTSSQSGTNEILDFRFISTVWAKLIEKFDIPNLDLTVCNTLKRLIELKSLIKMASDVKVRVKNEFAKSFPFIRFIGVDNLEVITDESISCISRLHRYRIWFFKLKLYSQICLCI